MCKLLMSINPEHVDNILAGTKKFEFRKNKCKEKIDSIIIYSTSPIMKVVAEVEVKDVIEDTPIQNAPVFYDLRAALGRFRFLQVQLHDSGQTRSRFYRLALFANL